MTVLVAYASKHGATAEIAERVASTLSASGRAAEAHPVDAVGDLTGYEAFVLGSALYFGHWLKPLTSFVRNHSEELATRPVWLFSSGPLGTETTEPDGHEKVDEAEFAELEDLRKTAHARDHRAFKGVLDPGRLTVLERTIRRLPAGRRLLPAGDFRDWAEIDGWAGEIARDLSRASPGSSQPGN